MRGLGLPSGSVRLWVGGARLLGHRVASLSLMCAVLRPLKNPRCRVAVEGRAQKLDWSARCAPAKYYDDEVPLHGYHRTPPITRRQIFHAVVSHTEIVLSRFLSENESRVQRVTPRRPW